MADAYVAIQRMNRGVSEILLAQKNIYLPAVGKYQYASIARNAVQYVLPGGRVQPGEQPMAAAIREFLEDSGVHLPSSSLQPLFSKADQYWFFKTPTTTDLDVNAINMALAEGHSASQKFSSMAWCSLDEAIGRLGNKEEYKALPWVTTQIIRAMNAGFSKEVIGMRANVPHGRFRKAIAQLILEAEDPGDAPAGATPEVVEALATPTAAAPTPAAG